MIHTGDCIEVMAGMPADSVDAVVTDPPYALEFMGKSWDRFGRGEAQSDAAATFSQDGMSKGFRALPSYLGGLNPRCKVCGKSQRGGSPCQCEHPQFTNEVLPRVLAFQAWCEAWGREALRVTRPGGYLLAFGGCRTHHRLVCGLEDAGWIIRDELTWVYASGFPKGKANLKPAHEPIVLARKPGPLRPLAIDECRIGTEGGHEGAGPGPSQGILGDGLNGERAQPVPGMGRWPSNLLLQDAELFDSANPYVVGSGAVSVSTGGSGPASREWEGDGTQVGASWMHGGTGGFGDTGGYSRFFIIPKSARADREPVLRGQLGETVWSDGREKAADYPSQRGKTSRGNSHPTVKPTDLMRHLVRLVTPQGGTVLDPFLGSGSTAIAAEMEGFPWIGIEKEPEYVAIAEARLNGVQRGLGLDVGAPTRRDIGKQRGNKDEDGKPTLGSVRRGNESIWGSYHPDQAGQREPIEQRSAVGPDVRLSPRPSGIVEPPTADEEAV